MLSPKQFSKHLPSGQSRFVRLFVCLFVHLFVLVFSSEVPFKNILAPTSRSRMSKILEIRNPWGKSNGKKWSHIWKLLQIKGVKLPRKKKSFFFLANLGLIDHLSLCKFGIFSNYFLHLLSTFWTEAFTTRISRLLAGFFWYWCYYPHWSRGALSPVCRILSWYLYLPPQKEHYVKTALIFNHIFISFFFFAFGSCSVFLIHSIQMNCLLYSQCCPKFRSN